MTRPILPPGQQLAAPGKWPQVGEREPSQTDRPWAITIDGLVKTPGVWTLEELSAFPQVTRTLDVHCVTRWSKLELSFSGVLLAQLFDLLEIDADAKFVSFIARSDRRHSTSLPLEIALDNQTLIALSAEGEPLKVEHGGPVRTVVPDLYFYKSLKWLERIELLAEDRLGYWEAEAGYHNGADPWREQRYMAATLTKQQAVRVLDERDFSDQNLRGIDAAGRELSDLNARRAILRDANFRNANLERAKFEGARLANAHFQNADLRRASFKDADLEGVNFSGADLRRSNLRGASLFGATFCEENFLEPAEPASDSTSISTPGPTRWDESSISNGALIDKTTKFDLKQLESLTPIQKAFIQSRFKGET